MSDPNEGLLERHPLGPSKVEARVRFLAKALAYGVSQNMWSPRIQVENIFGDNEEWTSEVDSNHNRHYRNNLRNYLQTAWNGRPPLMSFLQVYGYVEAYGPTSYMLTAKAIALLDIPDESPLVFISYRRQQDSPFALLVMARLQARGVENPFVDMAITGGARWEQLIQDTIEGTNTFISIFKDADSFSPFILKEIAWASRNPDIHFIPVCTYSEPVEYPDVMLSDIVDGGALMALKKYIEQFHILQVKEQSAREYNSIIVDILNAMGYAPR